MSLVVGSRLGSYEILSAIGAGGMGEVYRARDHKLDRDVAIKVLPSSLAGDRERLARFEREAKTLAALNHPHIGGIYGLEDADGVRALVLELVEGPTLADRIAQGPIRLDEALPIAKQIAEALEAAHEQGIIHRDLKPANIKLRLDGTVKVLDFGLAKALEPMSAASASVTASPTITTPAMMTGVGMILGTAAYMAPEQAKGRPADRRSDLWAFGCVLYEMLTGKRAFDGEDVPETLAAVLRDEPDWDALPASTPALIRNVVARCLAKDPKRRVADISVPLFVLDAATPLDPTFFLIQRRPLWRRALPVATAIAVTASVVGFTAMRLRSVPAPVVTRFVIALPEEHRSFGASTISLAVSPDGNLIAYSASGQRKPGLYLRAMADLEPRAIPGIGNVAFPVFSPDSRFIAFWSFSDRALKRISVNGGPAATLCTTGETVTGLSWDKDKGGVIFGSIRQGIMRVSASGGEPERLINAKEGEILRGPTILPGANALLFSVENGAGIDRAANAEVVVQSLRTGERTVIAKSGTDVRYVASGHLVYAAGSTLFALPFDIRRLTAIGQPVPVLEGVRRSAFGVAQFGVSDSGSLAFLPGTSSSFSSRSDIVVMALDGTEKRLNLPPASYEHPRVSPDGKQIAFDTNNDNEATVWIYNLSGTTAMRRLTFAGSNRFPIWSADSQRIAFQSNREGDLGVFSQRADGSGAVERLTSPDRGTAHVPDSWSHDGRHLLYEATRAQTVSLWALALGDKHVVSFGESTALVRFNAVFSPDGRWVAYANGTGAGLFVQPFPPTGAKYQLSPSGMYPLWSPDGTRLFYNIPGQFVAVSVTTQPTVAFGNPVALPRGTFLVSGPLSARNHDIMPDGKAIVGLITSAASDQNQTGPPSLNEIQVVTNWFEELKARVPTK